MWGIVVLEILTVLIIFFCKYYNWKIFITLLYQFEKLFGSSALSGKMLLVRIVENKNKIKYSRLG